MPCQCLRPRKGKRSQDGQAIFRFDTFGDEQFWTDFLRMHEAARGREPGDGVGVGLKVDVERCLPRDEALQAASQSEGSCRHADVAQA